MRRFIAGFFAAAFLAGGLTARAGTVSPAMYSGMHWRMIGPFRGGRTVAVSGIPGKQNVFFMAPVNGGIWKSNDYGRTWKPLFDGQPTGSIGALAVAPSDPQTIYAGSGEGLQRPDLSTGDGIYKSTDGGATWKHLGLRDAQQIGAIAVDPHDANRLWVAALGHPYGPNTERGVFRSTDGGATFQKVLYQDENTGAVALALDPADSNTIYADMWAARHSPWTAGATLERRDLSGLYKSTDGGASWTLLKTGLPARYGRVGLAIAPTNPKRLYAIVDSDKPGVYTSGDAGASWSLLNTEERISGRGQDFAGVTVDPRNERTVWIANTSTYRSTDGGKTYTAIKGAPGGDDYHTVWINPENPQVMILGVDQGATVTVNGGETWSSWYNQPTAQFFHVITDNQFPYWVYGAQQESGSAGTRSRSDYGEISFREWHSVGTEEYGYVAPDPLHPAIIYGGKVQRFDTRTGELQDVGPVIFRDKQHRYNRTAPLLFSPTDPRALYLGSNVVYVTRNGGHSWKIISPDLTRLHPGVPKNLGIFSQTPAAKTEHRGVIYSLALSPLQDGLIWAGTDEGLLWKTADGGKHWQNLTSAHLEPWSKVAQLEASHFDRNTAYAAINRFRVDDLRPYILRTHDGGRTWQNIASGIPEGASVNVVREDPLQRGLLFAGTERTVYVSFDDGNDWQALQLNLPSTSVRDLVVHGDDVVVGTHGRSFWILDNITPLRQLAQRAAESIVLFRPQPAYRIRWNQNNDTPLPPEEPAGENPPDGAAIDYYLPHDTSSPVVLEIRDAQGSLVRRYASTDGPAPDDTDLDKPAYWFRKPQVPGTQAGMHRFIWDLRYAAPSALAHDYPISAIAGNTPREPRGPVALPGTYTVVLRAGATASKQRLRLVMDPRIRESAAQLRAQFTLARRLAAAMDESVRLMRAATGERKDRLAALNGKLAALLGRVNDVDAEPPVQLAAAAGQALFELAQLGR